MPSLTPREELLKIHKKLYRENRNAILDSVIAEDPQFAAYERRYLHAVRDYRAAVDLEEMHAAVAKADIVYVGDYHTLGQSQRSFLRLLRDTVKGNAAAAIAFEAIAQDAQPALDRYMAGSLSDKGFLKKIALKDHWIVDLWENFRPLFDFARYHHLPLFGIEPPSKQKLFLKERDAHAAARIVSILKLIPQRPLFVFIGDLHLAPSHLPKAVEAELKKEKLKARSVILYQNSESIYWKLAERELEDKVPVVRIKAGRYCRMHTPPMIVQQSFLNWLQREEGIADFADAKHTFLTYLKQIADFLGLDPKEEAEEYEVYTCGDLTFLKRLEEKKAFSPQEMKAIKNQLARAESYTIPSQKIVYLADVSVNHAAEEAAHTLKIIASGQEFPRPMQDAFYANALHEALGFFGSKVINHRRRTSRLHDFRRNLRRFESDGVPKGEALYAETAALVLQHEKDKKPFHANRIIPLSADLFMSVTHALGYMLGERLFYGLMQGIMEKKEVRRLFEDPMVEDGETARIYFLLSQRLKNVKLPVRV